MVGLLYELFLAIRTTTILSKNFVGLVTHEMTTVRTDIISLEILIQFLTFLWQFRRIPIGLNKENNRYNDGYAIEYKIPFVSASIGNTKRNGQHGNESCGRTECIKLTLFDL